LIDKDLQHKGGCPFKSLVFNGIGFWRLRLEVEKIGFDLLLSFRFCFKIVFSRLRKLFSIIGLHKARPTRA